MRRPVTGIYAALQLLVLLLLSPAALPAASASAASRWRPPQHLTWYWQLQGSVSNSHPAAAYDIDGFDTGASEVSALHAAGKRVICYVDVGTWENWRSDAGRFPSSVLGSDNGWPGEKWLDVRQLSVLQPIITARFQMCKQKGFDAVEPDNIDGYQNSTGFPISAQDQLAYDEWVAKEAHSLGMAVFQKNDPDHASTLQPYFDGALDEQCNEYSECSSFKPYLTARKPVLNAEYQAALYPGFCSADNAAGMTGALYSLNLDGSSYQPCWSTSGSSGGQAPASGLDRTSPVVRIAAGNLAVRRGATGVRLSCPPGQSYCDGRVELDTVRRFQVKHSRRALVLGKKHFHLTGGHTAVVEVTLSRKALGRLGNQSAIGVVVRVTARDAAGRGDGSHRTVRLAAKLAFVARRRFSGCRRSVGLGRGEGNE